MSPRRLGVFAVAVVLATAGLAVLGMREQVLRDVRDDLTNSTLIIAEQTRRSFQAVDIVLVEIAERLAANPSDPVLIGTPTGDGINPYLLQKLTNLGLAAGLAIADRDGKVVASSMPEFSRARAVAESDYFRIAHDMPRDERVPIVGEPVRNPVTGEWGFVLARRLEAAGGGFAGVLLAVIDTNTFAAIYSSLSGNGGRAFSLLRRDGTMLARYPHPDRAIGQSFADAPGFRFALAQQDGSITRVVGAVENRVRLMSGRGVRDYPLVVIASRAESAILEEWRSTALLVATATLAAVTALIGLSWSLDRRFRQLAETAARLRESEAQYRDIAETSAEMIMRSIAATGDRLYVSPASYRLLGSAPAEVAALPQTALIHPDDIARVEEARGRMLETRAPVTVECRLRRADGTYVWVEAVAGPCTASMSGAPEYISLVRDISQRKTAETALAAARLAAEEASRTKSEFLANMSHEIRTPMTGVLGLLALLLDSPLADDQRQTVHMARESAASLIALIDDILDLSKLEAGKVALERVEFDPAALAGSAVAGVAAAARKKHLALTTTIAPEMRGLLIGDPARLRQILENFMTNAIKFTDQGGIHVAIGPSPADPNATRFAVSDTGIGIDPEMAPRLFGRFEAGDVFADHSRNGNGFGLAICRHLSQLMGGHVGVDSTPGLGSTFWLDVALQRAPDRSVAMPATDRLWDPPARPLRVLLAEDNDVNQHLVVALLSRAGHHVDVVANGAEALAAAAAKPFDVILMDIQMPVMDGEEATRCIRALPAPACEVPILALTAHAMSGQRERYLAGGFDEYLAKPFEVRALLGMVAALGARGERTPSELPAFEPMPLAELADHIPAAKLRTFVTLYLERAEERAARTVALLEAGDLGAVANEVHPLAGSSGSVGAVRVSAIARGIEEACRAADEARARALAATLEDAAREASAALRVWLKDAA